MPKEKIEGHNTGDYSKAEKRGRICFQKDGKIHKVKPSNKEYETDERCQGYWELNSGLSKTVNISIHSLTLKQHRK